MICSDCRRQYRGTDEELASLETRGLCEACGTQWPYQQVAEGFGEGFVFAFVANPLLAILMFGLSYVGLALAAAAAGIAYLFVRGVERKSDKVRYWTAEEREKETRGQRGTGVVVGSLFGMTIGICTYSLVVRAWGF